MTARASFQISFSEHAGLVPRNCFSSSLGNSDKQPHFRIIMQMHSSQTRLEIELLLESTTT